MFMGVSPGSKSNAGNAVAAASGQPSSVKILHFILGFIPDCGMFGSGAVWLSREARETGDPSPRLDFSSMKPGSARDDQAVEQPKLRNGRIFRRGVFAAALLGGVMGWTGLAVAQETRPQIIPGERKVAKKKETGPRAVGVLQMAGNGKVTFVPIAILVDGKFWDATEYKADPVPMALEPGTVYEAERTGSSLGLFTVNNALHSKAVNVVSPWIATGRWVPAGSEPVKSALKAQTVPVGIDTTDAPPRLTRDPAKVNAPASTPAASAPASSTPSSSSQASSPQSTGTSGSGDEPPRLKRSDPAPESAGSSPTGSAQTGSTQTGSAQTGQGQAGTGSTTPVTGAAKAGDSKTADNKAAARASVPESDSGADEGGRPRLRRGKPVDPLPEDDVPGYSKPGAGAATASAAADAGKTAAAAADKAPVETVPAISDASGPTPKSFAYEWLKDEEGERRQQVVALAKEQVRAYVEARARARILPKPAGSAGARQTSSGSGKTAAGAPAKAAAKTKDPILENEQMTTFDVWVSNQPMIVFSAEAHMPPPAGGSPHSDVDAELRYSILLVVYPDIYNNLHKVYAGVTDKFHLDLTPRLELIDAVDADGDGRGELLFREITDAGTGWVIYRPTADKLWKMFDSLKPE
jgi:hypothetical protein